MGIRADTVSLRTRQLNTSSVGTCRGHMKGTDARETIGRMLTTPRGVLSERASHRMYRRPDGQVLIGLGHHLYDEQALTSLLSTYRPKLQEADIVAIRDEWRRLRSGAGPDTHSAFTLSQSEIDDLLEADLVETQQVLQTWFGPPDPEAGMPTQTIQRDLFDLPVTSVKAPTYDDFFRLPAPVQQVLVYLCFRVGARNGDCVRELAISRDWQYLSRVLRGRGAHDDGPTGVKSIARLLENRARDYLIRLLDLLPTVGHRALAEEYEYITGICQKDLPSDDIQQTMLRSAENDDGLSALCLSGGGIRSASFCLGAIQVLARNELFGRFHYLSTVSGGGYIGTAITRWMTAKVNEDRLRASQALREAEERLGQLLEKDYVKKRVTGTRFETEGPLTWLRMHTNYLSRRLSLFSADTWTVVSTYFRNLFIVWMIFWPWVALFLFVPWFSVWLSLFPYPRAMGTWPIAFEAMGAFLGVLGSSYFFQGKFESPPPDPTARKGEDNAGKPESLNLFPPMDKHRFANRICLPQDGDNRAALGAVFLLVAGFFLLRALPAAPYISPCDGHCSFPEIKPYVPTWTTIAASQLLLAWLKWKTHPHSNLKVLSVIVSAALLAALIQSFLIYASATYHFGENQISFLHNTIRSLFLPPAILIALLVGETVKSALGSSVDTADSREHQGRGQALMVLIIVAWVFSISMTVLVPPLLSWWGTSVQAYAAAGSGVSLTLTVYYGYRPATPGKPEARSTRLFTLLGSLGIVLLALIISIAAWNVINAVAKNPEPMNCKCATGTLGNLACVKFEIPRDSNVCEIASAQCVSRLFHEYFTDVFKGFGNMKQQPELWDQCRFEIDDSAQSRGPLLPLTYACLFLAASFVVMLLVSRFIRMNEFSLHGFYRDRLIRGFYGGFRGVRERRRPHLFTGFDARDDTRLARVARLYDRKCPKFDQRSGDALKPPFLVVATALNLVKGTALAWQERKADSFTFTALRAGNYRLGYRSVARFAEGVKLGTAMAISGAAFNPNMGYNSNAPMAFLMSIFNVRLGWWLGNPKHIEGADPAASTWQRVLGWWRCKPSNASWRHKDPTCPAWRLLQEAAGQTSDDAAWIHLSDGGHFDNIGLWEMVHRRCRRILVIDASQDRSFTMEDFYSAIRKIRIDMGIEIDADDEPVQLFPRSARVSGLYFARFKVRYSALTGNTCDDGVIIYLKPCIYGSEPLDVQEYAEKSAPFPHEPTADQFFSESQFESYRKLGEWEMMQVLKQTGAERTAGNLGPAVRFDRLFQRQ